jgi:hypothetical protein
MKVQGSRGVFYSTSFWGILWDIDKLLDKRPNLLHTSIMGADGSKPLITEEEVRPSAPALRVLICDPCCCQLPPVLSGLPPIVVHHSRFVLDIIRNMVPLLVHVPFRT